MRVCRFRHDGNEAVGFYFDQFVAPLEAVAEAHAAATDHSIETPGACDLLQLLPPDGESFSLARMLFDWLIEADERLTAPIRLPIDEVELLTPIPRPPKLFLLAGNYAKHIEERGGQAVERAETFPYVFMKPPTTTLIDPFKSIPLPTISPDAIDWELELAVVIGRGGKAIREADALAHVAGYTIVNDVSNRRFRPNPNRKDRERDKFFDWLHGKWFDGFCPCGPCIASADAIGDPQDLAMQLSLNGELQQDSSTALQIFPVAAVIEFISAMTTLEPGDMISTGTPHGVGAAKETFLKAGDRIDATIDRIGTLTSSVVAER